MTVLPENKQDKDKSKINEYRDEAFRPQKAREIWYFLKSRSMRPSPVWEIPLGGNTLVNTT
jgi:hypothetical protein